MTDCQQKLVKLDLFVWVEKEYFVENVQVIELVDTFVYSYQIFRFGKDTFVLNVKVRLHFTKRAFTLKLQVRSHLT